MSPDTKLRQELNKKFQKIDKTYRLLCTKATMETLIENFGDSHGSQLEMIMWNLKKEFGSKQILRSLSDIMDMNK